MKHRFIDKLKKFFKEWKRVIFVLLGVILGSAIFFIVLKKTGILTVENILKTIRENETTSVLLFIVIRTVAIIFFGFMPGLALIFESVAMLMWGANFKSFCIAYLAIIISSLIQDAIGRFGGSKIVKKLMGQKAYDEATKITSTKGLIYVPFIYLFPFFPDDAICMIAGASKIKWKAHLCYILLFRGIGTACLFGSVSFLPESIKNFTDPNPLNYIRLIVWVVFSLAFLFKWIGKLDKYLTNKIKKYYEKRSNK